MVGIETRNGPVIDPKTQRPRIKAVRPATPDDLVKGVKPEIVGGSIACECCACGYGGPRDPWYGYFLLPATTRNQERADKKQGATQIQCPGCGSSDCQGIRDIQEQLAAMNKDELQAQVALQNQEIAELRRQLAVKEKEAEAKPRKPVVPESGQHKP